MKLLLLVCLFFVGCGYHFTKEPIAIKGKKLTGKTITIPYVQGDFEGELTNELTRALGSSGLFRPVQNGGEFILAVSISEKHVERLGYRYDRQRLIGKLEKKLIPTENRVRLTANVSLLNARTGEVLVGPEKVVAEMDYDYINSDSIRELAFITPQGKPKKVISFSLGQLDSVEGAQDAANIPLFRVFAQKIVDGIVHLGVSEE